MTTARDHDIPIWFLREAVILALETASGLRWRERPLDHFPSRRIWLMWNARYAEAVAGSLNSEGYFQITLTVPSGRPRHPKAHRIIYALTHGHWPPEQLDHENGVRSENLLGNLHPASNAQNGQNRKTNRNNRSGFPGVSWDKRRGKWGASIGVDSRDVHLGRFDTPETAYAAYLIAKRELHPFAPTPRGVPLPNLHSLDWMRAAQSVIRTSRRRDDGALELRAWDHFIAAL
jgi:hypothetical protein